MVQQVLHHMEKFQRKVDSLVKSNIIQPTDSIWKISFLFGEDWPYWKGELKDFGFSMQSPISHVLAVKVWED